MLPNRPRPALSSVVRMPTQHQIYDRLADTDLDPELSWASTSCPSAERTKHVHRLHPYLGKYVPQLVETFLLRHFTPGQRILDPFAGSGTTLVECPTYGCPSASASTSPRSTSCWRRPRRGCTTRSWSSTTCGPRWRASRRARAGRRTGRSIPVPRGLVRPARARRAPALPQPRRRPPASADLLRIVLCRAARSARLTTHFDLDFPKRPQTRAVPVPQALAASAADGAGGQVPAPLRPRHARRVQRVPGAAPAGRRATSATATPGARLRRPLFDGLITSPPYPGRIDYHEQHRYAFELLGLDDLRRRDRRARRRALRAQRDRRLRRRHDGGLRQRPRSTAARRAGS